MPCMIENTTQVVRNHEPHTTSVARRRSVRAARRVIHRAAAVRMIAAGISQEICPPKEESNIRNIVGLAVAPPPTDPVSSPEIRPRPLYPKVRSQKLLVCDPPMYGRSDAGVSITSATHQPAATTRAASAAASPASRRRSVPRASTRYARPKPGTTSRPCSCLVRNAKPRAAPHSTIQRIRPESMARTVA
ncbi:Uncharacterised protein [Rothia kristinae]|nr:Uncharacterised protein [Rothia kristinae]